MTSENITLSTPLFDIPYSQIPFIIAIDGLAGSGKSTLGNILSDRLGGVFFSTGLLYRAVGWLAVKQKTPLDAEEYLGELLENNEITFVKNSGKLSLLINNEIVDTETLQENVYSEAASVVARVGVVRSMLVPIQRKITEVERLVVVEGRDIGTVIFPNAQVKFFLEVDSETRVSRRQLQDPNLTSDEAKQLLQRDKRDSTRTLSPAIPAEDAILINNSNREIEGVLDEMIASIKKVVSE